MGYTKDLTAAVKALIADGWVEDSHGPYALVLVSPTLLLNIHAIDEREALLVSRSRLGVPAGSRGYVEWVIAVNGLPAWWGPYSGSADKPAEVESVRRLESLWAAVENGTVTAAVLQ